MPLQKKFPSSCYMQRAIKRNPLHTQRTQPKSHCHKYYSSTIVLYITLSVPNYIQSGASKNADNVPRRRMNLLDIKEMLRVMCIVYK